MNLYIPKNILTGFRKRPDVQDGFLGYVTYKKSKNVVYKQRSWENWRDKNIEAKEMINIPMEGFLFCKSVMHIGDVSYAKYSRMRLYDPRGFEFEISMANVSLIISHASNINNGEIKGKFIYSWNGDELILLPEKSYDYQKALKNTQLKNGKVSARKLIVGATYESKDKEEYVYVGRYDFYKDRDYKDLRKENLDISNPLFLGNVKVKKDHVFYNIKNKSYSINMIPKLSNCSDSDLTDNFDDILTNFLNGKKASEIVSYKEIKLSKKEQEDKIESIFNDSYNKNIFYKTKKGKTILIDLNIFYGCSGEMHLNIREVKKINENTYVKKEIGLNNHYGYYNSYFDEMKINKLIEDFEDSFFLEKMIEDDKYKRNYCSRIFLSYLAYKNKDIALSKEILTSKNNHYKKEIILMLLKTIEINEIKEVFKN
tara:strand:- start:24036 stop:25316 length:1281 start_codon:yes stop_codon:yes gene_type:complete